MVTPETLSLPAPAIDLPPPAQGKWQREYEAFQRLRPELLRTHHGQYVVIHNGQVVDSGTVHPGLALRFFTRYGNVPVHIGLVTTEPEPVARIPHYRELRQPGEA